MSIQSVVQKQSMRRSQVADSVADFSMVTGTVKLSGTGQGYTDINFPVTFIEKPTVSFGYELEQGYQLDEVATCNGVVSDWNSVEMKSGNVRIKGCSLGFVVDADTDTVSYLHFTFSGMAFRNPVSPSTDVRDPL